MAADPEPFDFAAVAAKAEARLRATPRDHLGPAGRLLMQALDADDAAKGKKRRHLWLVK